MDSLLKRQLALIKARAMRLRNRRVDGGEAARQDEAARQGLAGEAKAGRESETVANTETASSDGTAGRPANAIVDAVVATGAVSRGADFVPRPRTTRRFPWPRGRETRPRIDDILSQYKTGEACPIDVVAPGAVCTNGDHTCYVVTARGRDVDPAAEVEARRFVRLRGWPEHVTVRSAGVRRRRGERGARGAHSNARGPTGDITAATSTPGSTSYSDARASRTPEWPATGPHREHPFTPEKILFLDIETAGLSANTYLFLIGVMYLDATRGEWVCEQVFARDYAEEVGVLLYIRDLMERFDTVVTYNGQSFDLPFIRTRMAVHRIGDVARLESVDLLYTTRRVFREILPNRRLTTVERHLRRVSREGDIPGRYIPDAWHDFVATGDARVMRNVLYHNRMDLFTMAVILTHLAGAGDATGAPD